MRNIVHRRRRSSRQTVRSWVWGQWGAGAALGLWGVVGIAAAAGPGSAFDTQVVHGTQWSGRLGLYDFSRDHNLNQPFHGNTQQDPNADYDLRAIAVGGNIYAQTGALYGFSAGAGFSFSQALRDKANFNPNLVGATGHYRTLNRAYLQYNWPGLRLRAGRQNIHTPFASDDQFAFIPRSFAGVSLAIDPLALSADSTLAPDKDQATSRIDPPSYDNTVPMQMSFSGESAAKPTWRVYFDRMYKYESRQSDHFHDGNRYVEDTSGFYTLGTAIQQKTDDGDYIAQIWHYNFNDTADLQYVEGGYQLPALLAGADFDGMKPYARLQYVHENEAGAARLGPIDAEVYGAKLGVHTRHFGIAAVGHYAPEHPGSFRDGGVAHPYTDLSGVFYTDTMNDGVGDLGPGYGYGVNLAARTGQFVKATVTYVRYLARAGQSHDFYDVSGPRGFAANTPIVRDQHSWEWDAGVTLDLGAVNTALAGVKLQDKLGVTSFEDAGHHFYDNRLRLFYAF